MTRTVPGARFLSSSLRSRAARTSASRATKPVKDGAVQAARPHSSPPPAPEGGLFSARGINATRAEVERAHIKLVLDEENGRVESAARRLGIPRSALYWKMRKYGLRGGMQAAAGARTRQ